VSKRNVKIHLLGVLRIIEALKGDQAMKSPFEMADQEMRRSSENVDERMSLECEVEGCGFLTPTLGSKDYLAMVKHLQVHIRVVHGIHFGAGKCVCENRECAGFESRSPSRVKPRSRIRSRSRRGRSRSSSKSNVGQLDYPCPDCGDRSFATEAGLYMHRRKVCGLKGVKPTDLDFLCQGEGCGRAFSSPQGLNIHRRHCQKRSSRSQTANYESGAATSSGRSRTAGADVSHSSKVRRSATGVTGASSSAKGSEVESKVEMDVRVELEQGKHAVVKYRVNSSAKMQSVINKVAVKMKCDVKAVKLHMMTKTPAKPPGILRESLAVSISGIESASKYESSLLIATISV